MSAPAPPPDTSLDLNVDVTFLRAEFWFDMLEKAVLVVVNSMTACILLVIFSLVICLLTSTIRRVGSNPKRPVSPQILHFMISLVKAILWMAVIPILIMRIGIASDSLVAVVTSITLSVAMSVRPLAENLFAGVALLAEKIYSVGDVVVLAGSKGTVAEVRLGVTVLENPNGETITIPNMKVFQAPMVNVSTKERTRIEVEFEIVPTASMAQVRDALVDGASAASKMVLSEPAPKVIVKELTQTALVAAIRVWVKPEHVFTAPHTVREACREALILARVPLAIWRTEVANALDAMETAGFPGLADSSISQGKRHVASSRSARDKEGQISEEAAVQSVAIQSVAVSVE